MSTIREQLHAASPHVTVSGPIRIYLGGVLIHEELPPRRKKHRVGVHCERSCHASFDPRTSHNRWERMVARRFIWSLDPFVTMRPAERARRFFGGQRRGIVRRRGWITPADAKMSAREGRAFWGEL